MMTPSERARGKSSDKTKGKGKGKADKPRQNVNAGFQPIIDASRRSRSKQDMMAKPVEPEDADIMDFANMHGQISLGTGEASQPPQQICGR